MAAKKSTISKAKGVIMIADELLMGKDRKQIVQHFTKTYNLSVSAVDKWIKASQVIVKERREVEEQAKRDAIKETTEAMVKRLGLDREAILLEYKKVAFFDIRKAFTEEGGLKPVNELDDETAGAIAGIESFDVTQEDVVLGTTKKSKDYRQGKSP